MRITVTGATGLIGTRLVAALQERGDEVTVLSRRPEHAQRMLGVDAVGWHPETEPAPVEALAGRDGVVHLAGEPIAQRWTPESKERIRSSRELGTARLVEGLAQAKPRPRVLVSCLRGRLLRRAWRGAPRRRRAAREGFPRERMRGMGARGRRGRQLGMRTVILRTGVLLDRADGALARMLPPFRLGVGGPVAGGRQYISWITPDDLVRLYLAALDESGVVGPNQRDRTRAGDESRVRTRARPRAEPSRAAANPRFRAAVSLR